MNDSVYAKGIFGLSVGEEIDWSTDKIVSFSQLSMYNTCPRKWELNYVRKKKVPSQSIYFVYGQAMHTLIQLYLKTLYTETIKAADALDFKTMLLDELKSEYIARVKQNQGIHFSSSEELSAYYTDGLATLNYLKKKRGAYFSKKSTELVAIELPILTSPDESRPNIKLQCHLDLIFHHPSIGKYTIIDIKTSKNGWSKWKKKEKKTTDQLILYKNFFCEKFNIPLSDVDIQYFILKQKIDPDSLWPQKRIQEFAPAAGKVSVNRVKKSFQQFIDECFDDKGQYIDRKHVALTGPRGFNCTFCPFLDEHELCPPENRV